MSSQCSLAGSVSEICSLLSYGSGSKFSNLQSGQSGSTLSAKSVCIIWTHSCLVKIHCSNFRITTSRFRVSAFVRLI